MANLKKALAVVLAAATAFTFAPVANLGNAVEANAASAWLGATDITLKVNQTKTYNFNAPALSDDATATVTSSDPSVVAVANEAASATSASTGAAVANFGSTGRSVVIKGLKSGSAVVTATAGSQSETFNVTVNADDQTPVFTVGDKVTANAFGSATVKNGDSATITAAAADQALITKSDEAFAYNVTSVASSNTDVAAVSDKTVTYKKVGAATLTIKATLKHTVVKNNVATNVTEPEQTYYVTVNVAVSKSTLTVQGKTVGKDKVASGDIVDTIELNPTKATATISASIADAQGKTNVPTFTSADPTLVTVDSKTGVLAVTAAGWKVAGANDGSDVVAITVADNSNKDDVKQTLKVNVKISPKETVLTKLDVTLDGKTTSSAASFATTGPAVVGTVVSPADKTIDVALSTKDKQSVSLTYTPSNAVVTGPDSKVATYANGTLTAVGKGSTTLTIQALPSITGTSGSATITVNITVTDVLINNKITAPSTITLIGNNAVKINASATYGNTLFYTVKHLKKDQKPDKAENFEDPTDTVASKFTIDPTNGTIKFTGNATEFTTDLYLQISGLANATAQAPDTIYVPLKYSATKLASDLKVTPSNLNLKVGETGKITATGTVASGSAVKFVSYDSRVATVADDGTVKAVKAGSTQIEVTLAETDSMQAGKQIVYVSVGNNDKKPAKVTGVSVKNKKGAKVTVSWKKVSNNNAKYYVQKKVNGKTSGKSVGGKKATLSVKKGATVKVRVKAYYYSADGTKYVGKYSAWKTLKTDKK